MERLEFTSVQNFLLLPNHYNINGQSKVIQRIIESNNVFKELWKLEQSIQSIIESVNEKGMVISENWFNRGLDPKRTRLNRIITQLNSYIDYTSENTSQKQLDDFWIKNNMKQAYSNEDLTKYEHLHPTYRLLLQIKKNQQYLKQWETKLKIFGRPVSNGISIKGQWQSFSSYTGRITAKKLPLTSIPNYMKEFVVAPTGYRIISLDLNSAELRFLAYYSDCRKMLEEFEAGRDIYNEVAQLIQEVLSKSDYTDGEVTRTLAKKYVFSMIYGAGKQTILDKLRSVYPITTADVTKIGAKFNSRYPEIQKFLLERETSEKLLTFYGEVTPLANFSRNQKRNFTLQSSVAVAIKLLMMEVYKEFGILHIIHDELWILAPCREPTKNKLHDITSRFSRLINKWLPRFPTKNLLSRSIIG